MCALLQVRRLYTGPQDDEIMAHAISCNSKGPLLIHIAKLFPKPDVSSFDAFGRIFSGTVKPGDKACAVTATCAACYPGPFTMHRLCCLTTTAAPCGVLVMVWPDLSQLFVCPGKELPCILHLMLSEAAHPDLTACR